MKSILIYSGGLDSSVLLRKLFCENSIAEAISINYGQRHLKELEMARANCKAMNVIYNEVDISGISSIFGNSALTDEEVAVPSGEYASENMAVTVVPNRNMIMLSIAAARAMALSCDSVSYAAHSGDHALYADCTNTFADAVANAIFISSSSKVKLERPFINMSKSEIVKLGADLNVDFSLTWSCYNGGDVHCGRCSTCLERRQAFKLAGVKDPTIYAI